MPPAFRGAITDSRNVAEVANPAAFGVVEIEGDRVVGLEEKPKAPKSNLINAGLYLFPVDIFTLIDRTPKSPRGEFEITDTIRLLMADREVFAYRLPDPWIDVGDGQVSNNHVVDPIHDLQALALDCRVRADAHDGLV